MDPEAEPIPIEDPIPIEECREFLLLSKRVLFFYEMRISRPNLTPLKHLYLAEIQAIEELWCTYARITCYHEPGARVFGNYDWLVIRRMTSIMSIVSQILGDQLKEESLGLLPSEFRPSAECLHDFRCAVNELELVIEASPAHVHPAGEIAALPFFRLGESGEEPIVNGKRKKRLPPKRWRVFKILLGAGPGGLRLKDLKQLSECKNADRMIREQRKDPDYEVAIHPAGGSWGFYKMDARCFPSNE
jgi:hypothetical protein